MRSLRIYGVVGEKVKPFDSSGFPRHSQTGQFEMGICIVKRDRGSFHTQRRVQLCRSNLQSKEFGGRLLIPVLSPLALGIAPAEIVLHRRKCEQRSVNQSKFLDLTVVRVDDVALRLKRKAIVPKVDYAVLGPVLKNSSTENKKLARLNFVVIDHRQQLV